MATEALRLTVEAVDVACTHCGLPVAVPDAAGGDPQFCCAGCATAHAILTQHGLARYYSFADRRDAPVRSTGRGYDEFDHPAFAERYVTRTPSGLARVELYLEGVHCASCVWLVERIPIVVSGVARAELDIRRSLAVVEWDDGSVALSTVARGLDRLGYPPHPYRGVARDAVRRREDRAMLVRIGVAGAIAINVMLAALALYAGEANGMDPAMTRFFRWISLALVVPAFVWPGRLFFTGALAALRSRSLHMDLPIAIALAVGFISGAVNTIRDAGPVYFDGLSVLILLLLAGRFLQQRGQRLAADSTDLLHSIAPVSARLVDGDRVRDVPSDALMPGMIVEVRPGETFGADGSVVEGRSAVNAALLSGESRPLTVAAGDRVFAGTLNLGAPLRVRVDESGESSRIARILRQVEDSARRRAPVVLLADRMAGAFVAAVLTVAGLVFAFKLSVSASRAVEDAIALLIVTCPCALALATPLAMTVATARSARRGMLIKGADAIELLATPGTLVLDKTGTVTEGRVALIGWWGPAWVRPLVLSLEQGSAHPIAAAIRGAWPDLPLSPVLDARHTIGGGLAGTVDGHAVCIGSPRFVAEAVASTTPEARDAIAACDATMTPVHVAVDGELVAVALFGDRVRDDAIGALRALRARGWRTVLLSGDSGAVVRSVGALLEFTPENVIGESTPERKHAFVESLQRAGERVVMVGDGVNDAAAIAAAHVGIGVHGGAEACLSTADIYLARPGLTPLVELTDGSRRALRVIRRNIAFSLCYNIVGAGLAIAGVLTPLVAAILMPVSSLTVVLGSWYGHSFDRTAA